MRPSASLPSSAWSCRATWPNSVSDDTSFEGVDLRSHQRPERHATSRLRGDRVRNGEQTGAKLGIEQVLAGLREAADGVRL